MSVKQLVNLANLCQFTLDKILHFLTQSTFVPLLSTFDDIMCTQLSS